MSCIATTTSRANETTQWPPPAWVADMFSGVKAQRKQLRYGITLTQRGGDHFALVTAQLKDAAQLADAEFTARTTECYTTIAEALEGRTPARFWNHIPQIHAPARDGRDRYMVFNAGRFAAFLSWYGEAATFDSRLATASGIGHSGDDLIILCLATDHAIEAVDNPRQVRPHRYSTRYGPQPPCFARATRVGKWLMVGGTASVRGEDSLHVADLARQADETFANLDSLLRAANDRATREAFTELRVYFPNPNDSRTIEAMVRNAFPRLARLELMPADLCRRELLIEIEGLAEL